MLHVTPWFAPAGKTLLENCCVWHCASVTVRGVTDTLSGDNWMLKPPDELGFGANFAVPGIICGPVTEAGIEVVEV